MEESFGSSFQSVQKHPSLPQIHRRNKSSFCSCSSMFLQPSFETCSCCVYGNLLSPHINLLLLSQLWEEIICLWDLTQFQVLLDTQLTFIPRGSLVILLQLMSNVCLDHVTHTDFFWCIFVILKLN